MLDCRRDGMIARRSEDQVGVDRSLFAPHGESITDPGHIHRAMHAVAHVRLFHRLQDVGKNFADISQTPAIVTTVDNRDE